MKIRFFLIFSLIFWVTCSSTPGSTIPSKRVCPNNLQIALPVPGTPTPRLTDLNSPNWSLYTDSVLWQTQNTYPTNFITAWTTNGLSEAITQIGASNWATGIGSLKTSPPFKSVKTFTGYDRKALDHIGNPINANCSPASTGFNNIPVTATKAWQCNVYAQNAQNQPISGQCYFYYTPPSGTIKKGTVTLVSPVSPAVLSNNTCTIQTACTANCEPSYPTSCKVDSSMINGFSCSSWAQTTSQLSPINLALNNLYDPGSTVGCMSPATVVNTLTQWGGLGIGNQITYEDPSVTRSTELPAYLDATIMYANPYNNDDISGLANPTPVPAASTFPSGTDPYSILQTWNTFCSNNLGFCQAPTPGTSTGGLAHIIGQAGPISLTKYVLNLKGVNPTGYYTWQYDDAAGQTICSSPNSKTVGIFCPSALPLESTTTDCIFANTDSRFAVYNNCPYEIWVQAKPVPASDPVPAYCTPGTSTPNLIVDTSDCLFHLPSGSAHLYSTPATGLQSFNIWSKTGCDATGFNCKTGETGDNGEAGGNSRTFGAQPDIETAIEGTFGCTLADTSQCEQTQNGGALGAKTYLDITFVNGFTRPAQLQVIKGSDESNPSCNSTPVPVLGMNLCPTAEDLTTRP